MKRSEKIYERVEIGCCLCFLGGFLDAYTYLLRGGVFANAQTGNIILLIVGLISRQANAVRYLIPIVFFILGVAVSEFAFSRNKSADKFVSRIVVLAIECALLLSVAFMSYEISDIIVNATVSFVAAIQFNSFRNMSGLPFATAFCTGNLRSMTEYFFHAAANKDKGALFAAVKYLTVIVFFALGVICGCYTCWRFDRYAILFMSALALLIIIYMLVLRHAFKQNDIATSRAE